MVIAHAMWIHGNSLQVESPQNINAIYRTGFSCRIDGQAGKTVWLHFAIPTPVLVNDKRLIVNSVLVRYKTTHVSIMQIDVYDGEQQLVKNPFSPPLTSTQWQVARVNVPKTLGMSWGLGISVLVKFEKGIDFTLNSVEFSSAGADFV